MCLATVLLQCVVAEQDIWTAQDSIAADDAKCTPGDYCSSFADSHFQNPDGASTRIPRKGSSTKRS